MGPQSSLRQLRAYLALSLGAMTAPPPPRRSKKAATEGAAPSSATSAVPEDVRSPRPTDVHGAPPRDRGAKAGFTEVWQSPDGHLEPPPVVVSLLPPVSMRRSHHTSPPPKAAGTSTAPGLGASQWDAPLGGAAGSVPVALPRVAVVPRARAPQTACVSAVRAAHYTASPSPAAGDGGAGGSSGSHGSPAAAMAGGIVHGKHLSASKSIQDLLPIPAPGSTGSPLVQLPARSNGWFEVDRGRLSKFVRHPRQGPDEWRRRSGATTTPGVTKAADSGSPPLGSPTHRKLGPAESNSVVRVLSLNAT